MKYLLDTNVISELHKPNCDKRVMAFANDISPEDFYISVISIGEICYGVEKLPTGKKKHELLIWLYSKVPEWFNKRIITLDTEVLIEWGKIRAAVKRTLPVLDLLIASAAITHNMALVTRNMPDFEGIEGLTVINPWEY